MRAAVRDATSADRAIRRFRSTSRTSAAFCVSANTSRVLANASDARRSASDARCRLELAAFSVARRRIAKSSFATSWHCFLRALPERLRASTCAGTSLAARRNAGGCARSVSARSASTSLAKLANDAPSSSWSGSVASTRGAVRHTSLNASGRVSGAGAEARDSSARDLRLRFLASMKDTSHARKKLPRSTRLSRAAGGSGGRSDSARTCVPRTFASCACFASWSASLCAAPGVNRPGPALVCVCDAPKGGPAPNARVVASA